MIINKIKHFICSLLTAIGLFALQGQEKEKVTEQQLEEIIISATRTERSLSSLPLPAQIIASQQLLVVNAVRLGEILNEQTGLITVPDFGGAEGIQLQGMDSQYILFLIDGMPLVGRSAGTLDINRLSLGNVKQIEIVKGPSSSLYGNEALGGVVNIITAPPKEGFQGTVNYRYARFDQHNISTQIQAQKNKFGVTAFFNRFSSKGYDLLPETNEPTIAPFINSSLFSRLDYAFTDRSKIKITARLYNESQEIQTSGSVLGEQINNEWNLGGQFNHQFSNRWALFSTLYGTRYYVKDHLYETSQTGASRFFDQRFIRPELRLVFNAKANQMFSVGLGHTYEHLERTSFIVNPTFNSPYFFFQLEDQWGERCQVIAGFRYDDHSEYQAQFSPKFALRYRLNDNMALKASMGYGFKAPDFRQLYFDFNNSSVGYTVLGYNAVNSRIPSLLESGEVDQLIIPLETFAQPLKAESSLGINVGWEFNPTNRLTILVNGFRNDIKNLIDTRVVAQGNDQNIFSYLNIDAVYTQGIELDIDYKINDRFRFSGGYQLLYAKDKTAIKEFNSRQVFARPAIGAPAQRIDKDAYFGLFNRSRHMANLKLYYQYPRAHIDANLRITYRSRYGLFDSNDNGHLDHYDDFVSPYALWNVAINKHFKAQHKLGLGINNVFNYTDPSNITNLPGRIFYLNLSSQF